MIGAKSIQIIGGMFGTFNAPATILEYLNGPDRMVHSRGKSGKHTSKRSNAASFKRAATKRNNIRKHK